MELSKTVAAIAADLRRAAELGGEDASRAAELLVASLEPALRLHLLEALHDAASELCESAPGWRVDVRLVDREPVLALVEVAPGPGGERGGSEGLRDYAADELARLTVRLPEGLKGRLEHVAAERGASVNSWITFALAQALEAARQAAPPPPPGRRGPRRMTGFIQG